MYQEPSIVHVQMGFTHRRESCGRGMWRFVKVGFKCDLVKYNIWEIFAVIKDESIFTLTVFFSRLHSFTGGSGWAKCQRGKNKPIYFHLYIGAYELQPLHLRLDICVCCRGSPKKKLFLTKWEKNWKKTRAFLYQDRWVWNKWTSSQTFQSFVLMSWGCSNCGAFKPPLFLSFPADGDKQLCRIYGEYFTDTSLTLLYWVWTRLCVFISCILFVKGSVRCWTTCQISDSEQWRQRRVRQSDSGHVRPFADCHGGHRSVQK